MVTLKVNGKEVTVEEGTLILDAAKVAGYVIPTFCFHKDLLGVGSCRMCLVEIEGQKKLQPSCVTPVMKDMSVLTETDTVVSARASMLEFLLSNHALDCPVCDKGGECELQDLVYRHGPRKGVHAETKLSFHDKDYPLSDVIIKNSNRCVQCMRCVRVCGEVVGRGVLGAIGRGAHQEETSFLKTYLDCDHDGMCIEVCPVGCFMRRPYRYKSRPWDLRGARTVCPYCGTGCTMTIQERDGEVVRSVAKFPYEEGGFNGIMLCARGRFGYDFINSAERLKSPLIKKNGQFEEVSWDEALAVIKERFTSTDGKNIGAIASARLTNEELYLFQKLIRGVLNSGNIDSTSRWDPASAGAYIKATGIHKGGTSVLDCLDADTVLIVGSQVSDENPVTDYFIRRTIRDNAANLIIASPRAMKLDSSARQTLRHGPARTGPLLNALSRHLYNRDAEKLSGVKGIEAIKGLDIEGLASSAGLEDGELKAAAERLKASGSVSIMAGTDFIRFKEGIAALALLIEVLKALGKRVLVLPLVDRCNQRGAWDMGVHPGFGPGYSEMNGTEVFGCDGILEAAGDGRIDTLYVVGEDIVSLYPDEGFAREALKKLKFLVVQDIFLSETAKMADLVLPGASFAEKDGTFTNQEGRVQAVSRLLPPPGDAKTDLEIMGAIGSSLSPDLGPTDPETLFGEIRKGVPMYSGLELGGREGTILKGSGSEPKGFKTTEPERMEEKKDKAYPFELVTGNHLLHSGRFSRRAAILKGGGQAL
jgi:NADH-quinone oxidoreductase subunit G